MGTLITDTERLVTFDEILARLALEGFDIAGYKIYSGNLFRTREGNVGLSSKYAEIYFYYKSNGITVGVPANEKNMQVYLQQIIKELDEANKKKGR